MRDAKPGGGQDQLVPAEEEDYPFAFGVSGYYDLRQHWGEAE